MKRKGARGPLAPDVPEVLDGAVPDELDAGEEYENIAAEGADYADSEARAVHFRHVRFERVSLARSVLPGVTLMDAALASCDLAGAVWERSSIGRVRSDGCRWVGAHLDRAAISDLHAVDSSFEMAVFTKGRMEASRFERCVFRGAVFEGMTLKGLVFRGCDLRNADFRGSTLDSVDLRGCQIGALGVTPDRLRGLILDPSQAASLVEDWGAKVLGEDD
ncbi:MAG: pentapeptide repeat-containing protein [Gemmatimonadetes bacterium]|nr:pentapeptide repeat-containing protein [Gemmatimonadota bacterium]